MKINKQVTGLIVLTFMLTISGCGGGGGSDDTPAAVVPVPTTTDVVSVGVISGFSSVIMNGVEYNSDSATVTTDDAAGSVSDLKVGMVVSIHGTVDDASGAATASDIRFVDDAEGIVTSVNAANSSFVVLGRTVQIDEMTVFNNLSFSTLAVGNVVEVSGLWRSQERIQARHIERISDAYMAGSEIEVKGEISGLNTTLQQFLIGTQICDYSGAALDLDGETLADGLYVEVTSTSALVNGDLILDRLELRDRDQDRDRLCDSDCDFDLVGYVTRFVSPTDFDVDGFAVTTTDTTTYVNGAVADLVLDARVSVEGTLDANGVLVADTIVFRVASLIEIEADVEAIDSANATVSVFGLTITTNESTVFRDDSDIDVREFGLADLVVGDRIEVRAYLDGTTLVATKLERDDADDTVTLKAMVEAVSQPMLTLLGITVTSDQSSVFQNLAQDITDADSFFAAVTTDSVVKAEGTYDGLSMLASELSLRDCDDDCF